MGIIQDGPRALRNCGPHCCVAGAAHICNYGALHAGVHRQESVAYFKAKFGGEPAEAAAAEGAAAATDKRSKKKKSKGGGGRAEAEDIAWLDLRVGIIRRAWVHETVSTPSSVLALKS